MNQSPLVRWLSSQFVSLMKLLTPFLRRPRVDEITTEELARLLKKRDGNFVLVDVRSDDEINVSMIPGAISRAEFLNHQDDFIGKQVITYCTVGGRALLFAQQCARAGFEARSYRGSILAWCESGHPLVTPDGSPTHRVHTHSRLFTVPAGYERVY
ncbi:MAG: rhodanese-like domain-containing protein [Planctomycetales bacterium]|nr:rhodanese-like domain-containing protein [Planctomycetales bacterium]